MVKIKTLKEQWAEVGTYEFWLKFIAEGIFVSICIFIWELIKKL